MITEPVTAYWYGDQLAVLPGGGGGGGDAGIDVLTFPFPIFHSPFLHKAINLAICAGTSVIYSSSLHRPPGHMN